MASNESSAQNESEIELLRLEVEHLRGLVGPSEKSYEQLALDALGARDAAMRAEFDAGRARARVVELENEVRRWQRDFVWFRNGIIRRIPLARSVLRRISLPKTYLRPIVVRSRSLLAVFKR